MNNQSAMRMSLVLTLSMCTLFSGLVTVQNMWVYAQGNLSQVLNQTGNLTGNLTGNQTGNLTGNLTVNLTGNETFVQGKPPLSPPYPECFVSTVGDGYLFDLLQCSDNGSGVKYNADKTYYVQNALCITDNQDNFIVYPPGKSC